MKHFLLIIFLALAFFNQMLGQAKLEPGYIIEHNGDTIAGFIRFETDEMMRESIKLYANSEDINPKIFMPGVIKGFGFDSGRIFESVQSSNDTAYFAKRISSGQLNLLVIRYKDTNASKYYLYRSDETLSTELAAPTATPVEREGKNYNYKDNKYQGNLAIITENVLDEKELAKVKYRRKSIQKFVGHYNEKFSKAYPNHSYADKQSYSSDISVGIPVYPASDITDFRIAAYLDKTNVEKSTKISYRMGLSYRHWQKKGEDFESGSFRQQFLKIIPVGVRIQSRPKKIMPYGYAGLGMMIWHDVNRSYEENELTSERKDTMVGFALNVGLGLKFKVGKNYLFAEYTPAFIESYGFLNIGYSF